MYAVSAQFQVFKSIVVAFPVLVMYTFIGKQRTSQVLLHNKYVLAHIAIFIAAFPIWSQYAYIPLLVFCTAAPTGSNIIIRYTQLT